MKIDQNEVIYEVFMGDGRPERPVKEKKVKPFIDKPEKTDINKVFKSHDIEEYRQKLSNLMTKKDILSPAFWKKALKNKFFKDVAIVVHMELNNGNRRSFLQVIDKDGSFKFNKKRYVFDVNYRYWDIDLQMYCIDYHENLTPPVRRKIPASKIREDMENSDLEISYAMNPFSVEQFVNSKVMEGIMKGNEISEALRKYGIIILINLIILIIFFVIWLNKAGVFAQVKDSVGL